MYPGCKLGMASNQCRLLSHAQGVFGEDLSGLALSCSHMGRRLGLCPRPRWTINTTPGQLRLILEIIHEFTISYSYISSIILYLEGFRDPIRYLKKCLCTF